jgi:hypothetical protein
MRSRQASRRTGDGMMVRREEEKFKGNLSAFFRDDPINVMIA